MSANATADSSRIVVCIEDDRDTLELISLALRETGMTFIGVTDPAEAISVLKRHTPDIVLLDIMMPGVSGWDVFRHMRAETRLRNVPVIVITARASQVDRIYGEQVAKVDEYILKPFKPIELRAAIARALQRTTS